MVSALGTVLQPVSSWVPVLVLIAIALAFGVGTIVVSLLLGPGRTGPVKETIYEAGMVPVRDTRRRFNARFYIVAMIFVVFDVEIVFFYPWATIFPNASGTMKTLLLFEMLVFVAILLVAYVYAWGKGVFRWD